MNLLFVNKNIQNEIYGPIRWEAIPEEITHTHQNSDHLEKLGITPNAPTARPGIAPPNHNPQPTMQKPSTSRQLPELPLQNGVLARQFLRWGPD
jgi:hypothetical protein